jgi:N-methylhydantoinase A
MSAWAIGVDMGGTFIDVVACADDGRLASLKHPRDAGRKVEPIVAAIDRICAENRITPEQVRRIVHGSTVVTNLLLEQDAPPIAVLTNTGMRDLLALARQERRELYQPVIARPTPEARLFPEHLRFEIDGRIGADGRQTSPLEPGRFEAIAVAIDQAGVASVAVCLLFSHRNPVHEQAVGDWFQQRLPRVSVSLSSEVDPRPREFERFLVTAMDAYAKPMVVAYLAGLAEACVRRGWPEPWLMRSEGGIGACSDVAARPVALAMSGPCAALEGVAASLGGHCGLVLALDVGGTSTDIGLLENGRPVFGETVQCGDLSLRLRCVDVESLSIGGGSLVQVLAGGALRLGPRSAGASPGPAAYGAGGVAATLTDALCVLGRLPPMLAGGVALDMAAAEAAVLRDVALPLGLLAREAAASVVATAAAAMAEALKTRSFQRGIDPADGLLVAAGGGGAQHAAEVAELAGIRQVRVLPHAGVIAALGLLCAVPARTVEQTCEGALDVYQMLALRARARALANANAAASARWSLALCQAGQGFSIDVEWRPEEDNLDLLRDRFAQVYARQRGGDGSGQALQVSLLRVVFEQPLPLPTPPLAGPNAGARSAWRGIESSGRGPQALFAAMTTVWVPAGWRWSVSPDDSLLMQHDEGGFA